MGVVVVDAINRSSTQHTNIATEKKSAQNVSAVVLAAGMSERMGATNKLLLDFNGQSLLQLSIGALIAAAVSEIVVVLGHESDDTNKQLDELPVSTVVNPNYNKGQMGSVNCGLEAITGTTRGTMICLADQPLINATHIKELIEAFAQLKPAQEIVVPYYEGQRGNPIIISEVVRQRVLHGSTRLGCRRFIDDNPDLVNCFSVADVAYTLDIDTPDEYRKLLRSEH